MVFPWMSHPGRGPRWAPVLGSLFCFSLLASAGCQDESELLAPGDTATNVMTAVFVPDSLFATNPIELNGEVIESEWGGPLDTHLPYAQIRMTREEGSGNPGEPRYVSAKAFYTGSDIYFLFRWEDQEEDLLKDALVLTATDLPNECSDVLIDPDSWAQVEEFDEDRFSIALEMSTAGDALGTFREQGCQIACHLGSTPAFGTPGYGRLDVWQWLSTRTNLTRKVYSAEEDPDNPPRGTPGYLEDMISDPVTGLTFDPGTPTWRQNFTETSFVPLQIYRNRDDPFLNPQEPNCENAFGEECTINNSLEIYYIWRDDLTQNIDPFGRCDSTNFAPLPQGTLPRLWETGDLVSGYTYTYPTGSRADVRGKAALNEGIYTLEAARALSTGDPANDIVFTARPGDEIVFALAVFDNSGNTHWGSGPQVLRFGSASAGRPAREEVKP